MKRYFIFFILLLATHIHSENFSKNQVLYSWVDRLSFRLKPGLQSEKIGFLAQGEPVVFTGEKSTFKTKIKLRGKLYNDYWFKIKRGSNIGWVYAGGLQNKQLQKNKIFWRVVIVYCKDYEGETSEDWAWFSNDVSGACLKEGIIIRGATLKDVVEIKLDKLILSKVVIKNIMKKDWQKYCGYIFLQKDRKPHYEQHNLPNEILNSASKYFGFDIRKKIR